MPVASRERNNGRRPAFTARRRRPQACAVVRSALDATLARDGNALPPIELPAGRTLNPGNGDSEMLTLLAAGAMCTEWTLPDGRRQVLDFHLKGDIVHPGDALSGTRTMTLCDCITYALTPDAFATCRCHPRHHESCSLALARDRLAHANAHAVLLGRLTARERIAAFLLELAERIGREEEPGVRIRLPMGRDDIADYLVLNADTVSRQFSALKSAGAIRMPVASEIVIPDLRRLQALTPGPPRPVLALAG